MVGILLALQINNWNENRKKNVLKGNYIESLVTDLEDDLIGLNERLKFEEEQLEELVDFQKRLSGPDASIDTLINIARYEFQPYIEPNFSFNNSTYNALIATGDIELLSRSQNKLLNELNRSQKATNQTMEWAAQLYQTYIGAYTTKYPLNLSHTTIKDGPLNRKIWEHIEPIELTAEFNSVTGLKRNQHLVSKYEVIELLNKTEVVLEELRK